MEAKKRLVVSYKNCTDEVLEAIRKKYPNGYNDFVIKVTKPNGDFFYAITVDTESASYLVKVDVKIDNLTEEEFEKEFGEGADADDAPGFDSEGEAEEKIDSLDDPEE
jgi:hypothetical protein